MATPVVNSNSTSPWTFDTVKRNGEKTGQQVTVLFAEEPTRLSTLLTSFQKYEFFAFNDLQEDLLIDVSLKGLEAIDIVAHSMILEPGQTLGAKYLSIEAPGGFLGLGTLEFTLLGQDSGAFEIEPINVYTGSHCNPFNGNGLDIEIGNINHFYENFPEWKAAMEKARTIAGIALRPVTVKATKTKSKSIRSCAIL